MRGLHIEQVSGFSWKVFHHRVCISPLANKLLVRPTPLLVAFISASLSFPLEFSTILVTDPAYWKVSPSSTDFSVLFKHLTQSYRYSENQVHKAQESPFNTCGVPRDDPRAEMEKRVMTANTYTALTMCQTPFRLLCMKWSHFFLLSHYELLVILVPFYKWGKLKNGQGK